MKNRIIVILLVSFISFTWTSQAFGHLYLYTFEEQVLDSDIILTAKVVKTGRTFIGWKYASFEPKDFMKGKTFSEKITVQYGEPFIYAQEDLTHFEKGKSYVIILKRYRSHYLIVGSTSGYFRIENSDSINFNGKAISLKEFSEKVQSILENH